MSSREVSVHVDLGGKPFFVGWLWCHHRKGRESATFEYSQEWLKHPEKFALEPALSLTDGQFHTIPDQALFGAIGDSAPDRWGRVLMRRREIARAKETSTTARTLGELDYLLGVNDLIRQGALRFSLKETGPFLDDSLKHSIPPLIELPRLLSATERFLDNEESSADLQLLLAPGSSLGGARPKASVRDHDGRLSIAKFPRKDDEYNIVSWEAIVLSLAEKAGIKVPSWRLEMITEKPVLLMHRFDRIDPTNRIPFLSAMSMIGARDNEPHSYLEIADAILQHGSDPKADLIELWRRIVFSVLVSNTDDHLRNHGFLYDRPKGWKLSPAYDMNPTPIDVKPRTLTTSIDLNNHAASLDIAMSVAADFRLAMKQARTIAKEVALAVAQWRQTASRFSISKTEIERMQTAFEHVDFYTASSY